MNWRRGLAMPEINRCQAMVPHGARPINMIDTSRAAN
jgi:molybdopterin-biosynthesis enzyme MoeA-like protein